MVCGSVSVRDLRRQQEYVYEPAEGAPAHRGDGYSQQRHLLRERREAANAEESAAETHLSVSPRLLRSSAEESSSRMRMLDNITR